MNQYEIISEDPLDEYRCSGIHLRHKATGAEIYKIDTDDTENLFSFTFRTPPSDHSGAAHILEHSVLCGSERFPLKDPFLVLLKGSAHTFLNAMTYPDKTVYPAASTVKADFFNLLRVYGDAVFFPQLKREAFEQEGHRLEFDDEGRLIRAGIVLNEMKGAYSSAESVAGDWTMRSLFPDSPYSWDSGGDPEHIPSLTYEAFRDFHQKWYHPSNAKIFLYGDHKTEEVLSILDQEFLGRFSKKEIDSEIPLQARWNAPRTQEVPWPSESIKRKTTISMNWMLGESTDPDAVLANQVLSFMLLGHGGAPLQKAITDSGIGEDLSPVSGLETGLRQMVFSAALRGTERDKRAEFEALVSDTLGKLSSDGLDADLTEGALRSVEFRAREIRGGAPFGMRLMKRALRGWLHDRPPSESLAFDAPVKRLRGQKKGFFENLIRENLIENLHRSTVVVVPDPDMHDRIEDAERQVLDDMQPTADLQKSLDKLRMFQETPDSPENLARIPFLSRGDLPEKVRLIPLSEGRAGATQWYRCDTFSNGVVSLELAFDLDGTDAGLQCWMPLFGRALTDVGLPGMPHDEVARKLTMDTGSLGCSLEASPVHPESGGGIRRHFYVHLKALAGQWNSALDITGQLLRNADFSDTGRVGDLLKELRNDFRSAIVPSGHAFASLRAASRHSEASAWEDLWYGIGQLNFLGGLDDDCVEDACRALTAIRDSLFRQGNLSLVVTSDPGTAEQALDDTLKMTASLKPGRPEGGGEPELFRHPTTGESLSVTSQVSFSALSIPGPVLGSREHAGASLLAHILRTGYLWENIRMKGGAYGASASASGLDGTFTFTTYRDPVILPSLKTFRTALEWIGENPDERTVDMAVVACIGKELRPLSPAHQGFIGLKRRLYGITSEIRQNRRDFLLNIVPDDLQQAAAELLRSWEQRSVTVIAGSKALDQAAAEMPGLGESRITLPS